MHRGCCIRLHWRWRCRVSPERRRGRGRCRRVMRTPQCHRDPIGRPLGSCVRHLVTNHARVSLPLDVTLPVHPATPLGTHRSIDPRPGLPPCCCSSAHPAERGAPPEVESEPTLPPTSGPLPLLLPRVRGARVIDAIFIDSELPQRGSLSASRAWVLR
ncbi:Hypothetical predicted protein [Cloeon dipterum]|uniref:Uncharacterized protein n=1 Tax=Cloeon dipterum TaxID=197152 RepID=A0A8S1BYJ8_9INSE|nr:Hypothetical predicted protein [Cloeon dipterum]